MAKSIFSKVTGYKHIIWDWNGTILDDVDAIVEVVQELLREYQLPQISREYYRDHSGFPMKNFYEKIGFKGNQFCYDKISQKFYELYDQKHQQISPFNGIKDLLTDLQKNNIHSSVLSASEQNHLEEKISLYGLAEYFVNVYGLADYYANSKVARGKELMTMIPQEKKDILLVGDTDHDYEVGKELGVDVLLIADGHQSFERLVAKNFNSLPTRFKKSDL